MYQQEIRFFWPLTEQIPLPLNYEDCEKPKLSTIGSTGTTLSYNGGGAAWVTASQTISIAEITGDRGLTINSGNITIKGNPMPWYRKLAFKLMGFKWND
jgi:hypothetical protein